VENLSGAPKIVLLKSIFNPQHPTHGLFILKKKFNKERHCTRQYVLNLFVNLHGWLLPALFFFLGLAIRLLKVTERKPAHVYSSLAGRYDNPTPEPAPLH
jgi:hypothetical protein